jgi:hypothetical protein
MNVQTIFRFSYRAKQLDDIYVALRSRGLHCKLEKFGGPITDRGLIEIIPGLVEGAGRTTRLLLKNQREPAPKYAFIYESEALDARLGKNKACAWRSKLSAPLSEIDNAVLEFIDKTYERQADRKAIAAILGNCVIGALILLCILKFTKDPWVQLPLSASLLFYFGAYIGIKFHLWSGSRSFHEGFSRRNCWTQRDMNEFKEKLQIARFNNELAHAHGNPFG